MARAPRARTAAQGSRTPTEFETRVYKLCKQIPKGKVSTYGAMARVLGNAPRAVGQVSIMSRFFCVRAPLCDLFPSNDCIII